MRIDDKTKKGASLTLKQILEDGFEEIKKSELNYFLYAKKDIRVLYHLEKDEILVKYKVQ